MSQFPEEPLNLSDKDGFGYFPAYPGLTLKNNRYKITRKLAFGPRSSVWLASDLQENEYLALKILTVHSTAQKSQELSTLQIIKQAGHYDLPNLLDHFVEKSQHGDHQCFALAVLGPDVESLRLSAPTKSLPVHVVQRVIASVLEPLSDLHGSGITHGAVKAENISFFVGQTTKDLEPVLSKLPQSVIERKVTIDGIEYPIVLSQPIPHGYVWNDDSKTFADCSFYLNNVAHSQTKRSNPTWEKLHADPSLRPPEVILGTSFDNKIDIWMLGCATYQLLTGQPLVAPDVTEDDSEQLGWVMAMAGDRVKETIALKSARRDEFFNADGIFDDDVPDTNLKAELTTSGKLAAQDIPEAVKFLETCLSLDPEDRPTAANLMNNSWLKSGFACSCGYCG